MYAVTTVVTYVMTIHKYSKQNKILLYIIFIIMHQHNIIILCMIILGPASGADHQARTHNIFTKNKETHGTGN